jgi:hypothetical protein
VVLRKRLAAPRLEALAPVEVDSYEAFAAASPKHAVAFVDHTTLPQLASFTPTGMVIVLCPDTLQHAIGWLTPYPWLAHVVNLAMLEHPYSEELFANLATAADNPKVRLLDWIGPDIVGRRIRLTQAGRRDERIDKMQEFFTSKGVGTRTVTQLRDAAEELLTNAFYDAPVSAGVMKKPVSRTQDIVLPNDSACDLAYGFREDLAIVRVRDPFGSLARSRLVEVLTRCASSDGNVQVDESMGGAGLGMWRVFAGASFVGVSVVSNSRTEILVGIALKRVPAPKPFSFHFFFRDKAKRSFWKILRDDETNRPDVNKSVVIVKPR